MVPIPSASYCLLTQLHALRIKTISLHSFSFLMLVGWLVYSKASINMTETKILHISQIQQLRFRQLQDLCEVERQIPTSDFSSPLASPTLMYEGHLMAHAPVRQLPGKTEDFFCSSNERRLKQSNTQLIGYNVVKYHLQQW